MATKPRVVVVGGGVGGTLVANGISRRVGRDGADITLVDRTGRHVYQPGFVYVAFGHQRPEKLVRDEARLLRRGIHLVRGGASRIDPGKHAVVMEDGSSVPYDYLVLATGAELAVDEVPGARGNAHHFYTMEGALRLRDALAAFPGGRVVVAIGSVPYKCPPAPAEAACLLDYYFHRRGMRDRVQIHFLSPLPRIFPLEALDPSVTEIFARKDIQSTTLFNVESVDPEKRLVNSLEGESVPYDLLILVPPHHGSSLARASGLADRGGWIPTDRATLHVRGHDDIWAIGDATDIPISKAGATAHFEGLVVADNVAAAIRGHGPPRAYDGRVTCLWDAGFHRGITIHFDYTHPPRPVPLARRHYWAKALLNRLYWRTIPTALV